MDDLKIFIGGQWRHGSGNPMQSHFPADGTVNAALNAASLDDLQEAVEAGERAWREPAWRGCLPHVRAKILHKVADLIESRVDELAQMQSRDNGKPLAEARGLVLSAANGALLCRRLRAAGGRAADAAPAGFADAEPLRAARRGGGHHAVELADCQRDAEGRAGHCGG